MSSAPVERARELAAESRFVQLCRTGFVARGLLYILVGLFVFATGRTEDLTGALEYLGRGSGRLLLIAITVGLAVYGLWRLADGLFGTETTGRDARAVRKRLGAALAGAIYLYLAWKALGILLGSRSAGSVEQQADTLLDLPGGAILLGLAALVLVAVGLLQLRKAMTCDFLKRLDMRGQQPAVRWLGRFGYAARGIVFVLVGILIGRAAIDEQSTDAGGMEQALDLLSGPLLYAVALGLMLFGLFSIIEGVFRNIHEPPIDEIADDIKAAAAR